MTPTALLLQFRTLAASWKVRARDDAAERERMTFDTWHEWKHVARTRQNDAAELEALADYLERELHAPQSTLDRDAL